MSAAHENIDLQAQITRINRDIAETSKLNAETRKFVAEAAKLGWDRWIAPVIALGSLLVAAASFLRH